MTVLRKILGVVGVGIITWVLGIMAILVLVAVLGILAWNAIFPGKSETQFMSPRVENVTETRTSRDISILQEEYKATLRKKEILMATHLELALAYKTNMRHRKDVMEFKRLLDEKMKDLITQKGFEFPLTICGINCKSQVDISALLARLGNLSKTCDTLLDDYEKDSMSINAKLEKIEPATKLLNEKLSAIKRETLMLKANGVISSVTILETPSSSSRNGSFLLYEIEENIKEKETKRQ